MANDPLFYVVIISMLVVLGILAVGIGGFAGGGAFNKKNANKIMRYRLIAQLVAVIILVGFVALRQMGGN